MITGYAVLSLILLFAIFMAYLSLKEKYKSWKSHKKEEKKKNEAKPLNANETVPEQSQPQSTQQQKEAPKQLGTQNPEASAKN